jgi:hypothetical protein
MTWKSKKESILFWATDYDDDISMKGQIMQKIAELAAGNTCITCSLPKEWQCEDNSNG